METMGNLIAGSATIIFKMRQLQYLGRLKAIHPAGNELHVASRQRNSAR
jgi:hypothetical protein